jgi:hypothetical protein
MGGVCLERFGSGFVGVYSTWRDMSVEGEIRVREEGYWLEQRYSIWWVEG